MFTYIFLLLTLLTIMMLTSQAFRSLPKASYSFQRLSMASTYLLEYKYVANIAEKRTPYREGHIKLANELVEKQQIIAGGAFTPNLEGALFIFKADKSVIEQFIDKDPYVAAGLVTEWNIKEWNVVVGSVKNC